MNDAARVIFGMKRGKDISVTALLKKLHWLPMKQRSQFKVLSLVYKAIHNEAPGYICDMIRVLEPVRSLRSSCATQLFVPKARNKYGGRSFSVAGPTLWNTLPYTVRNTSTFPAFKRALKTFLFKEFYD